jgi:hypothetical protein
VMLAYGYYGSETISARINRLGLQNCVDTANTASTHKKQTHYTRYGWSGHVHAGEINIQSLNFND